MIASCANSRVKRIVTLQEKSKNRAKENVFIIEGIKMFEEAPVQKIREVYIEESLCNLTAQGPLQRKLQECRKRGIEAEIVTKEVFTKISDTRSPQGILCVVERYAYRVEKMLANALERQKTEGRAPLFLLLEDIQDPGNLGTMMRTAEGAGADGIILTKGTVDIYNPKTIRSTMGSLYRVPFFYTDELVTVMELLKQNGIKVYAAHLQGEKYYYQFDYQEGAAFLIGNEGNGLKKETADKADCYLKIPMEGQLESLNASIAAALLMYQATIARLKK